MARWRFFISSSSTPTAALAELDRAVGRTMSFGLNRPGEVSFSMPLTDPKADLIQPLTTCICVYKDAQMVWSGPVWTIEEQAPDNVISVKAVGWFEILNHRLMRMSYPDVTLPTFVNPSGSSNTTGWWPSGVTSVVRDTSVYNSSPASIRADHGSGSGISNMLATSFNTVTFDSTHTYTVSGYIRLAMDFDDTLAHEGYKSEICFGINYPYALDRSTFSIVGLTTSTWLPFSVSWTPSKAYASTPWTGFYGGYNSLTEVSLLITSYHTVAGVVPVSTNLYWIDTLTIAKTKLPQTQMVFTTTDAGQIVKTIVDDINGDASSGITVPSGTIQASANRSRTYKKYSNVGSAIQELVNIENGFDWTINPATKEMSIWYKTGPPSGYGTNQTDVVFGYLAGPNNLASVGRTIDGDAIANYVVVGGKYGTVFDTDSASVAAYGAREEYVFLGDVPNLEVLAAYAGVEVAMRNEPRQIYTIVPRPKGDSDPGVPGLYTDFWIGDIVYLNVQFGRMRITEQAIRVFGVTASIDDQGTEHINSIQTAVE